jgi:3-phenylpropionate/cinnamic acid dioxygenase small subunit
VSSAATEITNLLYRYAEAMDGGDFEAAAALFDEADLVVADGVPPVDAAVMLGIWRDNVIVHDDGTPRTRHVVTNPIIEVVGDGRTATCRSVYTVFQQVGDRPLAAIVSGRYHDEFALVDGAWRFTRRDYSLVDLVGDVSAHLRLDL